MSTQSGHQFNMEYTGEHLDKVAFPLGGIGAGMVCLEGRGSLDHISLHHKPAVFNEQMIFAAVNLTGVEHGARVLEGPVPTWKIYFPWGTALRQSSANGGGGKYYGLPRFASSSFKARFPFAEVVLTDPTMPIETTICGWSPFVPTDSDNSSLPCAALEYTLKNVSGKAVDGVFYFSSANFMRVNGQGGAVKDSKSGFTLEQVEVDNKPWTEGAFHVDLLADEVNVNACWFRGGWYDSTTMLWNEIKQGETPRRRAATSDGPSPGGSVSVRFSLAPGESVRLPVLLSWYVPYSDVRSGKGTNDADCCQPLPDDSAERPDPTCFHRPWYAARFDGIDAVASFFRGSYEELRARSGKFSDCFYDTNLPAEVVEAVSANLGILKSPTVLRQYDGRLWAWEGCTDLAGCCPGSCTHVWNYAQALPHLFPDLERSLRQTEFKESIDTDGRQVFRTPLPIRQVVSDMIPAADGQLGGILKCHREWRISGDTEWLRRIWPAIKRSLDHAIRIWDPDRKGLVSEPHHNTYDIEFWGPDGMCTTFYVGALKAAVLMGEALSEDVDEYRTLYESGKEGLEEELFDGDYFIQRIEWKNLRAPSPEKSVSKIGARYTTPEALALLQKEGPKYQYGSGCLSDGVIGAWMAKVCGVGEVIDPGKVKSHLLSVYRHNFRSDLRLHDNPQRPTFALGQEAGLLLCSWPKGGELSLPFVYSNEVWTGIEYQVASHLIMTGCVEEGLAIVRATRNRYDGRVRNPFDEYECGHWYARALSSYALLQALSGVRYDAVEKKLYVEPVLEGDFRSFFCAAGGYGTAGVRDGKAFLDVVSGEIDVKEVAYIPAGRHPGTGAPKR